MMYRIVITLCVLVAVSAQVPGWGGCPDIALKPTLNVTKYLGDWYEIQHFFAIFQMGLKCTKATYTPKPDGHINVYNRGIKISTGKLEGATGDAYVPDPKFPSKLAVRFSEFQPYGDYWVVDTDYKTYSVVYSCSDFVLFKLEFAWILSRTPSLDESIVQRLRQQLDDAGVKTSHFKVTDQTNCPPV